MGSNERGMSRNFESGQSKQESRNEAGKLELDKLIFLSNAELQTRVTKVRRVMTAVRMTPFEGRRSDRCDDG